VRPRLAVIINPISGTAGRRDRLRERVQLATELIRAHDVDGQVLVSEYPGHARQLAASALAGGITTLLAWGGDGTLNEVASVVASGPAVLGLIPGGSGNGLARELGIPLDARDAFVMALAGRYRTIDCGELDGRLFFNVAGIGLDARVAHQFATHTTTRRGFRRYLEITGRELFHHAADEHTVTVDGSVRRERTLMIAIANGRQYGNGALIAPEARLDDGLLDVVVIGDRPVWRALTQVPRIFLGQIARVPRVTILRGQRVEITAQQPMTYHVDGEPFVGGIRLVASVHRGALKMLGPGS